MPLTELKNLAKRHAEMLAQEMETQTNPTKVRLALCWAVYRFAQSLAILEFEDDSP